MVKNEHSVVIGCSPEVAFQFVTDFETWRQWHGSDQDEAEKVTPGPVAVGTVWNVCGSVQGQPIAVTIEVTRYEPYSQYEFKITSGPIDARQMFAFEHIEGGTKLTTVLELADPQLAQSARQQWDNDLLTLKKILETQAYGNPDSKGGT